MDDADVSLSFEAPDLVDACDPAAPAYDVTPEMPAVQPKKAGPRVRWLALVVPMAFLLLACTLVPSSWTLLSFTRDGSFVVFEVTTVEWVRSPVSHGWLVLQGDKLSEEDFGFSVAPDAQRLLPEQPSETTVFGRTITLAAR